MPHNQVIIFRFFVSNLTRLKALEKIFPAVTLLMEAEEMFPRCSVLEYAMISTPLAIGW